MHETGLPGSPKTRVAFELPEQHGLAGTDGDFPEIEAHARRFQCRAHEVVIADGGPADGDEDVGAGGRLQLCAQILERICRDAENLGRAARALDEGCQTMRV